MQPVSPTPYARALASFLVLTMIGGWFGEVQIPARFLTADAATNVAQLRGEEAMFRIGFAVYLIEAFSDLVISWLFYVLLRPVHRDIALLGAFFGIVSMTLFAAAQMVYFSAPVFVQEKSYFSAFTPQQLDGLANAMLSIYVRLGGLFTIFYGTAWVIRGWLTWRATYLPKWLGILMIVAGAGFIAKNLTKLLAPELASDLLLAPMFLNVLVLAGWLIIRGIDAAQWRAAAAPRSFHEQG